MMRLLQKVSPGSWSDVDTLFFRGNLYNVGGLYALIIQLQSCIEKVTLQFFYSIGKINHGLKL